MRRTRTWQVVTAVALAAAMWTSMGNSGCKGTQAPVTGSPTVEQKQATQALGVRIADEARRGLAVARVIRSTAQGLVKDAAHPNGVLAPDLVRSINDKAILLGRTADPLLAVAEQVTTDADLQHTAAALLAAFTTFSTGLPKDGTLGVLTELLDGGLTLVRAHAGG